MVLNDTFNQPGRPAVADVQRQSGSAIRSLFSETLRGKQALTSDELDQVSAVNGGEDGVEEEPHSSGIQQSRKRYSGDSVQRGEDPSELREQTRNSSVNPAAILPWNRATPT
jgi:hypothetical protein